MTDPTLVQIFHQAVRAVSTVVLPTLMIPVVAFGVALLQGMMGIREESIQYAIRIIGIVLVLAIFGSSMSRGLLELMNETLR